MGSLDWAELIAGTTECERSAQCASFKHHFDDCAERVQEQHENPDHKGPKEDCVEECEYIIPPHCPLRVPRSVVCCRTARSPSGQTIIPATDGHILLQSPRIAQFGLPQLTHSSSSLPSTTLRSPMRRPKTLPDA